MSDSFNLYEFLQKETDIEKVKTQLYLTNKLLEGYFLDCSIYRFLLGLFDMRAEFQHCENPLVSIVIPVKNEFILTQFLLNSISNYTQNIPYEVIIADDNSTDNTQNIKEFFSNVIVIQNDVNNPGFIYNVKNAIKHAKGEYILLLNNDMLVMENYLAELLKVIKKYPNIGIVGAKTITTDNLVDNCGANINKSGQITILGANENINFMDDKEYIDCDYCSGCAILFKKELWEKTGGFDEIYTPAYWEDSDFAFNVKYNHDLKSVAVPKSKIIHFRGVSYAKEIKQNLYFKDNKKYFLNKWENYLSEE